LLGSQSDDAPRLAPAGIRLFSASPEGLERLDCNVFIALELLGRWRE
jgi:hypothetical protein